MLGLYKNGSVAMSRDLRLGAYGFFLLIARFLNLCRYRFGGPAWQLGFCGGLAPSAGYQAPVSKNNLHLILIRHSVDKRQVNRLHKTDYGNIGRMVY